MKNFHDGIAGTQIEQWYHLGISWLKSGFYQVKLTKLKAKISENYPVLDHPPKIIKTSFSVKTIELCPPLGSGGAPPYISTFVHSDVSQSK